MTKKTTMQTTKAAPSPKPAKAPTHYDVLVTANGQVGAYGYSRGIILTGVPADLLQVHAWMSTDTAAVKAARATGADVVPFRS